VIDPSSRALAVISICWPAVLRCVVKWLLAIEVETVLRHPHLCTSVELTCVPALRRNGLTPIGSFCQGGRWRYYVLERHSHYAESSKQTRSVLWLIVAMDATEGQSLARRSTLRVVLQIERSSPRPVLAGPASNKLNFFFRMQFSAAQSHLPCSVPRLERRIEAQKVAACRRAYARIQCDTQKPCLAWTCPRRLKGKRQLHRQGTDEKVLAR